MPQIAFDISSKNLQEFSDINFHTQQKYKEWKILLKNIVRPNLKDPHRLLFYLSEQIVTCMNAMEIDNTISDEQLDINLH